MADRFFSHILEASEQLSNRLEGGLSALFAANDNNNNKDSGDHNNGDHTANQGAEHEEFDSDEDDYLMHNPLQGIADHVMGGIMTNQIRPETPWEHVQAFTHAIRWTEPFIIGLLSIQLLLFVLTLLACRRNVGLAFRATLMLAMAIGVKLAERMNQYGNEHWRDLRISQNYFDKRGIFVTLMWCTPILVDAFIMLVCFLYESSQLLVQVKTRELQKRSGNSNSNRKNSNSSKDKQNSATKETAAAAASSKDQSEKTRSKREKKE